MYNIYIYTYIYIYIYIYIHIYILWTLDALFACSWCSCTFWAHTYFDMAQSALMRSVLGVSIGTGYWPLNHLMDCKGCILHRCHRLLEIPKPKSPLWTSVPFLVSVFGSRPFFVWVISSEFLNQRIEWQRKYLTKATTWQLWHKIHHFSTKKRPSYAEALQICWYFVHLHLLQQLQRLWPHDAHTVQEAAPIVYRGSSRGNVDRSGTSRFVSTQLWHTYNIP